jgi:hypothetical protein
MKCWQIATAWGQAMGREQHPERSSDSQVMSNFEPLLASVTATPPPFAISRFFAFQSGTS